MNPNADAFIPIYSLSTPILHLSPASEHFPCPLSPAFFQEHTVPCQEVLEEPQAQNLGSPSLPCITLILICLLVLLVDLVRMEGFLSPPRTTGDSSPDLNLRFPIWTQPRTPMWPRRRIVQTLRTKTGAPESLLWRGRRWWTISGISCIRDKRLLTWFLSRSASFELWSWRTLKESWIP